jgi:5-methylcytosine-specific restriction endonuclease McrA
MLRDGQVDVDASWGEVDCNAAGQANRARRGGKGEQHPDGESSPNGERHREIDRELRALARQKSRLEVDEARWLREADRHRIWRKLGFSTALEYLEDVFGYAPRTAKDRLRVAKELAELPELEAELRDGKLPYSAARELTRVMTCATEAQWLARARGKNLRDIEELVAGHKKGDGPDDPKDPALMTRTVVLKLAPRADALLQQTRALFEAERGEHLDDEALIEAMCLRILEGGTVESIIAGTESIAATVAPVAGTTGIAETIASVAGTTGIAETIASVAGRTGIAETIASVAASTGVAAEKTKRAKAPRPAHQIVVRTCDACSHAAIESRGNYVEIAKTVAELARCDAEVVREADLVAAQSTGTRRPKPTLTIPQKTRDLVWARDEGRCRFPGCRATRNLALHHLEHRAHGGSHDEWNIILLCDGHHKLLHEGVITIAGRAPDALVFTRDGEPLGDARAPAQLRDAEALRDKSRGKRASRFDEVVTFEHAKRALDQLGYKRRAARRALEEARAHVGTDAAVQMLVKTVLALESKRTVQDDEGELGMDALARQALVQSGFSPSIASKAVVSARAELEGAIDLATLIREALQRCRG